MALSLARRWWLIAVRGAAAVAFGLYILSGSASNLQALASTFGLYALLDGILGVAAGRPVRAQGGFGMAAGWLTLTVMWPSIAGSTLLLLISLWAVTTGIATMVAAVRLRQDLPDERLLGLSGGACLALGLLLLLFAGPGALSLVMCLGAWAVVHGVASLFLAARLFSIAPRHLPRTCVRPLLPASPGEGT